MSELGDWMRAERTRQGLSQVEAAERGGMTHVNTWISHETGKRDLPRPRTMAQIAKALGVTVEEVSRRALGLPGGPLGTLRAGLEGAVEQAYDAQRQAMGEAFDAYEGRPFDTEGSDGEDE